MYCSTRLHGVYFTDCVLSDLPVISTKPSRGCTIYTYTDNRTTRIWRTRIRMRIKRGLHLSRTVGCKWLYFPLEEGKPCDYDGKCWRWKRWPWRSRSKKLSELTCVQDTDAKPCLQHRRPSSPSMQRLAEGIGCHSVFVTADSRACPGSQGSIFVAWDIRCCGST